MREIILILSAIVLVSFSSFAYAAPTPVEQVDLARYAGRWYQIAAIPASFQKDCVSDTTAEYSPAEKGLLKVVNSCKTKDGAIEVAEGRARMNPEFKKSSQLQVTFVKFFKWIWAAAGDYWVVDLGSNYEYSVVGHPDYKYGWILSRTPSLSSAQLQSIERKLKAEGYDTCAFVMSETETQKPKGGSRLCDIGG